MVFIKRMVLLTAVFLLALFVLSAQSIDLQPINLQPINLHSIRVLALSNSRSLAKYNLSVQSSLLDERSRVYSNLPSLSAGASASVSLWNAGNAEPVANPFDTFSSGASVSVSQKIFEGGKSVIQKAINEIAVESARNDALAEYYSVLEGADSAYYAVLEAMATLEAEESSLESSVISLAIAEIRQTSGIINQGDYLKALADKEARENSRNQARRNLSLNTAKLKAITGLEVVPPLEKTEPDAYQALIERLGTISDEKADSLYTQFLKLLSSNNLSLARASLARERSQKNLSMAKSGYLPSLGASFSTGLNYTPDRGLEMSGGRVSLSASIPVDFWVLSNNVEKSRIAKEQAALDYLNAEINLETELQSALLNIFSYAGTFLSSRRSLEYTEKHFEYVMERYRLSQCSVSDYVDASTLLITSRNNYIKANYGFLQSLSKLRSLARLALARERLLEESNFRNCV
jgi:outer membrane protein